MPQTTYCYNPKINAMSTWNGVAFSRIWKLGSKHYGFNQTGIYELTGALDETIPVTATAKLTDTNFGTFALKRLHYIRLDADGDVNKPVNININFDDGVTSSTATNDFNEAMRCKLGRGAKGRQVAVEVSCASPGFVLRSMELYPVDLQRGVQ